MHASPAVDASNGLAITLAGERLLLRGDRSLYWPARDTLYVADTHFGKASVFRRRGMNLPKGTTGRDLERLSAALNATAARRLVVLGDFMHAPPTADDRWPARVAAWRAGHPAVEMTVLRGNHDRVGALDAIADLHWETGTLADPPFLLCHEPRADAGGIVLAGHIHPVVRLGDGSERLRVAVFWQTPHALVLPAFCSFAGGGRIAPEAGDRLFAVGDGDVVEVPLG